MNVRSVSCSSGTTAASALPSCDLTRTAKASTSSVINNEAAIGSALRQLGASLRMIGDGDIAAAIAPSLPEADVDLYMGIGGAPEAVLAAAAIKCLGGDMQCRMWPRDEKERKSLVADGHEQDLDRIFSADDLAHGQNIIFCATGISDSALLQGVRARGGVTAITHSILMRAKSKTVRFVRARHDLQIKTIRLRSDNREHIL